MKPHPKDNSKAKVRLGNADIDAGSRMHVLDWVESPEFLPSLRKMLAPGPFTVPDGTWHQPKGRIDARESVLTGKEDRLLSDVQREELLKWWLVHRSGAKLPTWDLVVKATTPSGAPALILVEAKAHRAELSDAPKSKPKRDTEDAQARSDANHQKIADAITEASNALNKIDLAISVHRDESYQLANRLAFSWKLASMGIPVALVYLGFVGDDEIADGYFKSEEDWMKVFTAHATRHFPGTMFDKEVRCGEAGFWLLPRTLAVKRLSPPQNQRRKLR